MKKEELEKFFGREITENQHEKAETIAKRKLQLLIQRFGDSNGVRRTPEYLAELVIEALKSELLTEYTSNIVLAEKNKAVLG